MGGLQGQTQAVRLEDKYPRLSPLAALPLIPETGSLLTWSLLTH